MSNDEFIERARHFSAAISPAQCYVKVGQESAYLDELLDEALSRLRLPAAPAPHPDTLEPTLESDSLIAKDDFHSDPVEQLAFELAAELEVAELSGNDFVTVNREKLRDIARRLIGRNPHSSDYSKPEPIPAPVEANPHPDTERFDYWFGPDSKHSDINEYLRGVREGWTADQWRAWIDAARKAPEPGEKQMKTGPYREHADLTGAEIDTLYCLWNAYPSLVEPRNLPSKVGCFGLVRRGLAAYMRGGSAVLLEAGTHEYLRRNAADPASEPGEETGK